MGATRQLAQYVVQTSYDDLPGEVKEMAKICLLDWFGVTRANSEQDFAPK